MQVYFNNENYIISPHALRRMAERGIKIEDIQNCIDEHFMRFIPELGYSVFISDHKSGKCLQVVLNPESKQVVTAVFLGD